MRRRDVIVTIDHDLRQMLAGGIGPAESDLRVHDVIRIGEKDCGVTQMCIVIGRKIAAPGRSIILDTL